MYPMYRKLALGCLVPALLSAGLIWYGIRALRASDPPKTHYETVDRGVVDIKVTETGTIEPLKETDVKSKVAGRIALLTVDEGSVVRTGQVLAKIDPREINSQVAQIQAQVDGARARYEQARRAVGLSVDQTGASIAGAQESLRSAEERLRVAHEQRQMQPALTSSTIAQAQASLRASQDNLQLLKNSTHPQAVVQAQSAFDDAKAADLNARRNLQRQQNLLQRGFVSQQVVDSAESDLAAAKARLDQAKKRLDLIDEQNQIETAAAESSVRQQQAALATATANASQVAVAAHEEEAAKAAVEQARAALDSARAGRTQDRMRRDDVTQAGAAVDQLENQLKEIQVQQGDTTIVSPMPGVVTRRYVELGDLVMSGVSSFSSGTPIVQVADLSRILVKMSINEVDVHKVHRGLPVEITIDGVRGVIFRGHVTRVAPAAIGAGTPGQDAQAGQSGVIRFAVEVTVDKPDPRLKPGMSAKCSIIVARHKDVLRLPSDGVTGDGASAKVTVVSSGSKNGKAADMFTTRTVRAGLRGDSFVEIISGVKEGDRVKPTPYTGPKRKEISLDMH